MKRVILIALVHPYRRYRRRKGNNMMTRYQACLLATAFFHVPLSFAQDKLPIPPAGAQAKALTLIKEVYGQEWEEAKTSTQKQALVTKLLQKATETPEATDRYVLLDVARQIAVQAGDADLAFKSIEAMAAKYDVDAYRLKGSALSGAAKSATTEQSVAIGKLALALVDEAVERDDFVAATFLGGLAVNSARKGRDIPLVGQIVERNREVEEVAEAFADIEEAMATLKSNPVDPDANLAVGRYHCLVKGNWERGLPMLALGSGSTLNELAVKELREVSDIDGQMALGDGWWDVAAANEGVAQKHLQERAALWYRKAMPGLSGLVKDRVVGRLESILGSKPSKDGDDTSPKDEWISIFDGRSLKGWQADQNANMWSVIDGAIIGNNKSGQMSHLYYKVRDFENFEARMEVNINSTGNSGFYFRATPGQRRTKTGRHWIAPLGYEVQIIGTDIPAQGRTGSLQEIGVTKRQPATVIDNVVEDDSWFTLHVVARGNHVKVSLDGKQVLDNIDPGSRCLKGYIALQVFTEKVQGQDKYTQVSFRNLMVKPLP